jgi:hypothetical protein
MDWILKFHEVADQWSPFARYLQAKLHRRLLQSCRQRSQHAGLS